MNPYLQSLTFYGLPLVQRTKPSFPKTILRTKVSPVTGKKFHITQNRHRKDTEKTQKRHRKDTEKTPKRHRKDTEKKRQAVFSATKPRLGYRRYPAKTIFFGNWVSDVTPTRGSNFLLVSDVTSRSPPEVSDVTSDVLFPG